MSNTTPEPTSQDTSSDAFGGIQWKTITIWSRIDGFDKDSTVHRRILNACWLVARRGSKEDDPPTKILVRSGVHNTTTIRNKKEGTVVTKKDKQHITASWTTKKLNELGLFCTAHGYIDDTNPAAVKVVAIRFAEDGPGRNTPQNTFRTVQGFSVRNWPLNNEGRDTELREVLDASLPKDWKELKELPSGTEPILTL